MSCFGEIFNCKISVSLLSFLFCVLGLKNPSGEDSESSGGSAIMTDLENLPRFHINGKGESSGVRKWSAALKKVRLL